MTNDLSRRMGEHKRGVVAGHTARYRIHRLVFFEQADGVLAAIAREKQIKDWRREKKLALIKGLNPAWDDLAESI